MRLFGTVGWIVVNVAIDLFGDPLSAQPLYVAAVGSLVMGIYAFTLPHTPPARLGQGHRRGDGRAGAQDVRAIRAFASWSAVHCSWPRCSSSTACMPTRSCATSGPSKPTALQTLAQASEIVCLLSFPLVLARYGFKVTLAIGVFGWVVRNALFATGWLPLIAIVGLPLHGMCFTFFFVVTNVYVDRHAPPHLRASAQGILHVHRVAGSGRCSATILSAEVLRSSRRRWRMSRGRGSGWCRPRRRPSCSFSSCVREVPSTDRSRRRGRSTLHGSCRKREPASERDAVRRMRS